MDVQLSEDLKHFVQAQLASGRYASEEEVLRDVGQWLHQKRHHEHPDVDSSQGTLGLGAATPHRFLEAIDELMKDVPEDELAKLPTDGAKNLDHYLYGAPKRR